MAAMQGPVRQAGQVDERTGSREPGGPGGGDL